MKSLIVTMAILTSVSASAFVGEADGLVSIPNEDIEAIISKDGIYAHIIDLQDGLVSIPNEDIEAIISKDGIYTRMIDVQNGPESFNGIIIHQDNIVLPPHSLQGLDAVEALFNNGSKFFFGTDVVSGGDMGGGG